jgi:hypothetical protein
VVVDVVEVVGEVAVLLELALDRLLLLLADVVETPVVVRRRRKRTIGRKRMDDLLPAFFLLGDMLLLAVKEIRAMWCLA